jgi:hypothetical protein
MEAVLELNQKAKPVHPMYSFECGTWLKIRVNGPEGPTVDYGMLCAMPGEQTYTIVSLHNGYFYNTLNLASLNSFSLMNNGRNIKAGCMLKTYQKKYSLSTAF